MGCRAWGTLNFGSPVIATLERLDCDWETHSCTFPDCGLVCATVLGKARGAESHWDMRIGQGRLGSFFHRQCDRAASPVASGLGHAMFVGTVACDLSWREGAGDRTSLVGVVRAPEVCAWVRWRYTRTTRKDALSCAGGCAQLREETCALDHAMMLSCTGSVRSNLSVIGPSVGEVDHSGCARRKGCPRRRVACILWRVGEVLIDWWALSRCEQEDE
ncbi:hypothetical protein CRG98_045245 [Punica granatum]|uniref:Uncharacterized protein n=1 Tax=Punica granatum TaxID=22663 RepID=A0A2I0HRM7_PUNGR|nr:hypothetical protein CRG98_045245 [Punica granatum]